MAPFRLLHRPALAALAAAGLLLAACGGNSTRMVNNDEYGSDARRDRVRGRMGGGDGLVVFGVDRSAQGGAGAGDAGGPATGLGVNAYLWRATLDTLSFMPLASADPFGGLILTEWYAPPAAQGERFKVNATITGRQLRSDALSVKVFKQVQQGGGWADAPVAAATASELEDRVLARARELRTQSAPR